MVQKFKETQKSRRDKIKEKRKRENEREVYNGINTFETNLAKFGLQHT